MSRATFATCCAGFTLDFNPLDSAELPAAQGENNTRFKCLIERFFLTNTLECASVYVALESALGPQGLRRSIRELRRAHHWNAEVEQLMNGSTHPCAPKVAAPPCGEFSDELTVNGYSLCSSCVRSLHFLPIRPSTCGATSCHSACAPSNRWRRIRQARGICHQVPGICRCLLL